MSQDEKRHVFNPELNPLCVMHSHKLDDIKHSVDLLSQQVEKMHAHMFVGNGNPAWSVRLAKLEQIIGGVVWLAGASLTAAVGLIVERVFRR